MADITMCSGKGCDKRVTCYRYMAPKCPYAQSMFVVPPIKDLWCEYYWEIAEDFMSDIDWEVWTENDMKAEIEHLTDSQTKLEDRVVELKKENLQLKYAALGMQQEITNLKYPGL